MCRGKLEMVHRLGAAQLPVAGRWQCWNTTAKWARLAACFKSLQGLAPGCAASWQGRIAALQQSRGANCTSPLQGLEKGIDYKKVLKAFKKDFCCNGTVVDDPELGQVRQQRVVCMDAFLETSCAAATSLTQLHGQESLWRDAHCVRSAEVSANICCMLSCKSRELPAAHSNVHD